MVFKPFFGAEFFMIFLFSIFHFWFSCFLAISFSTLSPFTFMDVPEMSLKELNVYDYGTLEFFFINYWSFLWKFIFLLLKILRFIEFFRWNYVFYLASSYRFRPSSSIMCCEKDIFKLFKKIKEIWSGSLDIIGKGIIRKWKIFFERFYFCWLMK